MMSWYNRTLLKKKQASRHLTISRLRTETISRTRFEFMRHYYALWFIKISRDNNCWKKIDIYKTRQNRFPTFKIFTMKKRIKKSSVLLQNHFFRGNKWFISILKTYKTSGVDGGLAETNNSQHNKKKTIDP